MPVYSYRAINEDGKEVRGSIDSADADTAKRAIEDLHLEVVEVTEATRLRPQTVATPTAPASTFAFEGTDPSGVVRRGTIQAATKPEAFEKLRSDQKLTLTMLAPMGTLPKYNDPDLESWQKDRKATQVPVQSVNTTVSLTSPPTRAAEPAKPRPTVSFTPPPAAVPKRPEQPVKSPVPNAERPSGYHAITTTLRLYAGWLLAWYGLFVAVGYYATVRKLPWDIPFVQAFFVSPLIFSFTVAIFLFLMLSEIHRILKGRLILGCTFALLGAGCFFLIRSSL